MVGQLSGVNTDIFYRGADDESEFSHANARALQMAESGNFFIDDTPSHSSISSQKPDALSAKKAG
jgi:replicative DNA helicase